MLVAIKIDLVSYRTRPALSSAGLSDLNFANQGFLIENQDFIRIFFFQKTGKNQEFFSEVQEIFISSLKDQISISFRFIIEN